ncbi:hypothetical protein BD770DRAFT_384863 [Pilaira anomala]|nr:hypothetical protein BD770DRAFT_384863 [Pilaira anomala]
MNNSQQNQDNNGKQRKKKATRACSHCQKAHLTCDDSRPCQRCIKRGLESSCTDGIRKKAKYLQEDESDSDRFQSSVMTPPSMLSYVDDNKNNNNFGFGSDTVNLEYGMLSSMIPNIQQQQQQQSPTFNNNTWINQPQPMDPNTIVLNESTHTSPSISSNHPDFNKVIRRRKGIGNTPEEIYARVQKPYNYAESYHYLIQYVKHRMGREELIRISRALVLFRPSYMSLIASLTEEDLIYMEKCVQRTLLEFEKLISFSGTPTVVWRRTGEIVLVGKEFLLLTQWTKETLLGKKTYIYELMDNGSAIEYWEKFSQHAFDNAESGVYMSVILMSPSFRPVPCSFCFTLKRDIFDLPCVVVGNFLPILGVTNK